MNTKPLNAKSYGSIPHLPGSRLGPGDFHIHEGQARIATEKARDKHDLIIVQEKLDGSNVAVAKVKGEILALTRSGYLATTSPYDQHHYFAKWVKQNEDRFLSLLNERERVCGEWLAMAHGTKYDLPHEPFVPFDIMTGAKRIIYNDFIKRIVLVNLTSPNLISIGQPFPIESMLECIKESGHGAVDEVEGAIWRVERKGVVDFLAKYVDHNKQDGKYFAENNNGVPVWNCNIDNYK